MPGQKKILIILLICFFFAFFISFQINRTKKPSITTEKKVPLPTAGEISPASVSLSAENNTVATGESFTVKIILNSPKTGVDAADFNIKFDKNYLKPKEIIKGQFFRKLPVTNITEDRIKISGIASLENNVVYIPKGQGEVVSIVFEALSQTSGTKIEFDIAKTKVASGGNNILGEIGNVDITVE